MAAGCCEGIRLAQVRPNEERQEAASPVTAAKLCFPKDVEWAHLSKHKHFGRFLYVYLEWFLQTYRVSVQVCIQMYVLGLRRAVCEHTFKSAVTPRETTIETGHKIIVFQDSPLHAKNSFQEDHHASLLAVHTLLPDHSQSPYLHSLMRKWGKLKAAVRCTSPMQFVLFTPINSSSKLAYSYSQ